MIYLPTSLPFSSIPFPSSTPFLFFCSPQLFFLPLLKLLNILLFGLERYLIFFWIHLVLLFLIHFILYVSVFIVRYLYLSSLFLPIQIQNWPRMFYRSGWLRCVGFIYVVLGLKLMDCIGVMVELLLSLCLERIGFVLTLGVILYILLLLYYIIYYTYTYLSYTILLFQYSFSSLLFLSSILPSIKESSHSFPSP